MAWAIEREDVDWVARLLKRFPALTPACDTQGRAFRELAAQPGNEAIRRMFAEKV